MYANYFGFRDIPFRQLSDSRHVYMSAEFESAREELLETLTEDARLVLLMGHAGTGKTKLLRHLHAYLEPSRPIFYLPFSPLQIETFIAQTAVELDIELDEHVDLFQAFQDGLRDRADDKHCPVLLVDDAHNLGCDVLENFIDLFQLAAGQEPLAQVVLAAHPEMEYTLQRPELKEFEENLARLSRLQPLATDDVGPYIMFALRSIGYEGESVFTLEAIRRVAAQTRGVPQLINTVCEAAFLVGYGQDCNPITPDIVDAAVEEVAGFAMGKPSEPDLDGVDKDVDWLIDDDTVERQLPGVIESWLARSRRWPIAAVGVGGTVALTAVIVLLVSVPFEDNAANARIRNQNTVLAERMETLRTEVQTAHHQRDNLQKQLNFHVEQRDLMAEELLEAQAASKAAELAAQSQSSVEESSVVVEEAPATTAEQLLAELMQNAESVADSIALKYADELSAVPGTRTHTVKPGDTLWNISERSKVSVEQLMTLNGLKPGDKIILGRQLEIATVITGVPLVVAESGATAPAWYTVKPGDSLYGIGRQFDNSVADLKRWNQLSDTHHLLIGQRLRIAAR